ncbi:MAG: hypothetical protein JSS51_14730 [Planctomycetes bacterium]|nr:hypothetical protein [Planctomycetota bacterium]
MRAALRRWRFATGVAVGIVGAWCGASMLGMSPPAPSGIFVTDGDQVVFYTPRVVDPWKVIGVTSTVQDGRTYLFRLYENGAIDYLTPLDGPRTSLGIANWTPIAIDPKLSRLSTP